MSDTPPSIPPRKRPTPPVTGGSGRTSDQGGAVQAAAHAGGSSWSSIGTGDGTAPPTYSVDVRSSATTSSSTGRTSVPSGPRTDERPRPPAAEQPRAPLPAPAPAAGEAQTDDEPPSPLVTAVDATTVWLKKAAGVTGSGLSRAYSQLTRPRTEDAPMTTTPTTAGAATAERVAPRSTAPVTGATPRPATGRIPTVGGGPRRVRLAISRVDPWSVMKLAFLLSVAIGVMIVVAAIVVWFTLDSLQVFSQLDGLVRQVVGPESPVDILAYVSFEKTVSAATLVGVIDVFLLTALATIGAFLYNIVAALVGGVTVTMTDE
ncbi:DUF3566 domain-containing protein [Cellulomonas dongxiuzhuiae]|uniref:DUF3566 domain-containing protein n=1 Tax=Cellulomonas dongxiuzhuiae TaxID=2819979 RepID=UPI001AAE93CD|nr:DUF3566 domain-containing protein [Cellulomonas dongxiuzhuiae]MBO3089106.1 DUF3566 domain-containing protein [Cellulomonas dongxiuzhuiae]